MITFILAVCGNVDYVYSFPQSPPSRAAWIEISRHMTGQNMKSPSPPSRAAWIEIDTAINIRVLIKSPPSRAAWIEIEGACLDSVRARSPPSRAAWIEISPRCRLKSHGRVAAFTGGVD